MTTSQLPISGLVRVTVNLGANAAQTQNLSTALVLGSSPVIDTNTRIRAYQTSAAVATDFGTTAPEYLAALAWFSQVPQPSSLLIGRWAKTAAAAQLIGGSLSVAQQAIAAWNAITAPGFVVTLNGKPYSIAPASFAGAVNLNGVAALIQTALAAAVAGTTCVWNASFAQFQITDGVTGASSTIGYLSPPAAVGEIVFASNPSAAATITIGGTAVTFVTSLTTGNQILIGASLAATLANAVAFLNSSADAQLSKATYSVNQAGTAIEIVFDTAGASGNSFTIAASAATPSGATLAGGSTTDISAMLAMQAASSGSFVAPGVAAESAVTAAALFDNSFGQQWYALVIPEAVNADHLAVAAFIESTNTKHLYGVTTSDAGVLTSTSSTDIAALLQALGYNKTFVQYSSGSNYAVLSAIARQLAVDYTGQNTVITLMYKQEPGVTAENLNATQLGALEAKGCNVLVAYNNGTSIIRPAKVSSGQYVDTIVGMDANAIEVQTGVFNELYTTLTKIPQTDQGIHILATAAERVMQRYVTNGLFAPGFWNQAGFGTLRQGAFMDKGYYVFQPLLQNQSQSDRAARKAPLLQIAGKLAGAVHFSDIAIFVNQ